MDVKKKLENEIARKKKLIEDSEKMLDQIPKHLRPNQEMALGIYKKELEILERELIKLGDKNSIDKKISNI